MKGPCAVSLTRSRRAEWRRVHLHLSSARWLLRHDFNIIDELRGDEPARLAALQAKLVIDEEVGITADSEVTAASVLHVVAAERRVWWKLDLEMSKEQALALAFSASKAPPPPLERPASFPPGLPCNCPAGDPLCSCL